MRVDNQAKSQSPDNTRLAHDLGGFLEYLLANGIDAGILRKETTQKPYEERADAILLLLSNAGKDLLNIHAMRRASEKFSHEDYLELSYYDRWVRAIVALCIETGIFSTQEWEAKKRQVMRRNKSSQQRQSD